MVMTKLTRLAAVTALTLLPMATHAESVHDFLNDFIARHPPNAACIAHFTSATINDILTESPTARRDGIKVLEVIYAHDTGSDATGLKCGIEVMLNYGGNVVVDAGTQIVNGRVYRYIRGL